MRQTAPMAEPPCIFFDTNEGTHEHGYLLWLPKSKADLEALGDRLRDGLQVMIVMPDELEMLAILRWAAADGAWVAHPVPGTLRYIGAALQWSMDHPDQGEA